MAGALKVTVGSAELPGEVTSLKRSDELLWSEGTGRAASTGSMTGSVVAQKFTYSVEWGVVTQAQYDAIRKAVGPGFLAFSAELNGVQVASGTVYRGTISAQLLGVFGGTAYYKGVTVDLVEK